MFYGLSRSIKKILPKRLFYRGLLIVAVPIIGLQIIISIVFFDSLWIKTNKGMTKALVNEINTFIEVYDDAIYENWEGENTGWVTRDTLLSFARDTGLNSDEFTSCMNDLTFRQKVLDNEAGLSPKHSSSSGHETSSRR